MLMQKSNKFLFIDNSNCPDELRRGLAEIKVEYPHRFSKTSNVRKISFVKENIISNKLSVIKDGINVTVRYYYKNHVFRALGRLLGENTQYAISTNFEETAKFDLLGIMVDVSRNGVLKPETAKKLIRHCSLMGINTMMLYTEDTYEVAGEPFFGYLRGRYTYDEMHDLDKYADIFGIEIFPCIQTLAHLEQILQWPVYSDYRDTDYVLIAEEEKTYTLIEKMIASAIAPFRSKRIHLGMDEAHGIGSGRYKERHGQKSSFTILNNHLNRVRDICKKHGLKPMIWSDMYFRLGSKTNDYYDKSCSIPLDVIKNIPKEVELVYWDYKHTDSDFYAEWIERHRALGSEPLVASGIWTWNRFWAALPFSFTTIDSCMRACKDKNLRQAFVTMWGDDGMECDIFSALPGIQFFAEHGYADYVDKDLLRANFHGSCDSDFDDWVMASGIDSVPCLANQKISYTNISKWLLWQDTLIGMLDPQISDVSLKGHYEFLADKLLVSSKKTSFSRRLLFPSYLAKVLSLKCELRKDLAKAYRTDDKKQMRILVENDLSFLRKAVDKLWKYHRNMWLEIYKPFGLEVIEHRYGGLRTRIESLSDRLKSYLDGEIQSIPELETKLEKIFDVGSENLPMINYSRAATPSYSK